MNSNKTSGIWTDDPVKRDLVDFRHLGTFREVYQEKSHFIKGSLNRKSVARMVANLERAFECPLFTDGDKGSLVPSPFADRLFNDLRFLEAAQGRLEEHVLGIHEAGRILHVSSSQAIFRTRRFRGLFRDLQMTCGVRPSFSPVDAAHAGKALASGQCDLYVGFWTDDVTRFSSQEAGIIRYRNYHRLPDARQGRVEQAAAECHVVALEGNSPLPPAAGEDRGGRWKTITEQEWLHWLDHPEKCPAGTRVLGPEMQIDDQYWQAGEEGGVETRPLQVTWLRQHSYEFLPGLMGKLGSRAPGQ